MSSTRTQSAHHDLPVVSFSEAKKMRKKGFVGEVLGGMRPSVDAGVCGDAGKRSGMLWQGWFASRGLKRGVDGRL
jgi:hypothetical protein